MKIKSIAAEKETMDEKPMLRYVLYARKSSEDVGAQAKSLPDQIKDCVEYAENNGLVVVETLKESHSAKISGKRPIFSKMLKDLQAGKYDGILAWHPDRLARNSLEAGMIVDMVDNGVIKDLKFPTLAFTNDSSGKLLLNIMFAMSKQYSEHLSESVQRGVNSNLAQGKSGGIPKWGYTRSEITGLYEPDENFDYIRHAFDMYLEGHTQNDIIDYFRKNDVHRMTKITRKNKKVRKITTYNSAMVVSTILSDPFYYGMLVQAGQSVDLREIQTNFKPMLTEEEFGAVQARRKSLKKAIMASVKVKDDKVFVPFRQFVKCGVCGNYMYVQRSESATKKKKFLYLRCSCKECTRDKKNIRGNVALEGIYEALDALNFTKKEIEYIRKDLTDYITFRHDEFVNEKLRISATIKNKQRHLEELTQSYVDLGKDAPKEAYQLVNDRMDECKNDIASLQADYEEIKEKIFDPKQAEDILQELTNSISSLGFKMRNGSSWEKDQLARKILTNIEIDNKNRVTYRYKRPVSDILNDVKNIKINSGAPNDGNLELIYYITDWWFLHPEYEFRPKALDRDKCPRIEEFIY